MQQTQSFLLTYAVRFAVVALLFLGYSSVASAEVYVPVIGTYNSASSTYCISDSMLQYVFGTNNVAYTYRGNGPAGTDIETLNISYQTHTSYGSGDKSCEGGTKFTLGNWYSASNPVVDTDYFYLSFKGTANGTTTRAVAVWQYNASLGYGIPVAINDPSVLYNNCEIGQTCIASTDPYQDEQMATGTASYVVSADYYVNSDDFCGGFSSIYCTTYISMSLTPPLSTQKYEYVQEVGASDTLENITYPYNLPDSGTYTVTFTVYNRYITEWLFGSSYDPKYIYILTFYVGTPNTAAEKEAYQNELRADNYNIVSNLQDGSDDIGTTDTPGVLALALNDTVNTFLHLPPWGYVTVFNQSLQNGTTTGLSDNFTLSFATSSPLHGMTLALPMRAAVDDSISFISAVPASTDQGNMWETFLYWWEKMWYMIFIIWLISELLGLSFTGYQAKKQSGSVKMSGGQFSTARDQRNSTHTLNLKK